MMDTRIADISQFIREHTLHFPMKIIHVRYSSSISSVLYKKMPLLLRYI